MRLLLFHPGAARIDCGECQKFVFDLQTGERETYKSGPERKEVPYARNAGESPPCHKCPKESPERARQIELSEKNWQAYGHYLQAKAVGLTEAERRDPIVRRNFALIDMLVSERKAEADAEKFAEAFVLRLASVKK